jgi:hypothetical protein
MFLKRYNTNFPTQFLLKVNDKVYDCSFCDTCGQYLYSNTNKNIRKISCLCNDISKIFQNYKLFIEEIPDITSGDELDDYIENPKEASKDFMKYIYNIVLFGITYEKEYFKKVDDHIISTILEYTV